MAIVGKAACSNGHLIGSGCGGGDISFTDSHSSSYTDPADNEFLFSYVPGHLWWG